MNNSVKRITEQCTHLYWTGEDWVQGYIWPSSSERFICVTSLSGVCYTIKDVDNICLCADIRDSRGYLAYQRDIFEDDRGYIGIIYKVPGGFAMPTFMKNPDRYFLSPLADAQTAGWFTTQCTIIGNTITTPELIPESLKEV
jgi:hypothetical protein